MSGLKDFKKVAGEPEDLPKLQERLQEFFQPLLNNPLLDGTLLTDVEVGTTPTLVAHKLRRPSIGWLIVDRDSNATVWSVAWPANRDLSKSYLQLQASAATKVSIWVF